MALLTINNLTVAPLSSFTAQVDNQQLIVLQGESGSGKSRLLYAIADLVPHSGELYLGEQRCLNIPANTWRQQVMLVPSHIEWWYDTALEHFNSTPDSTELQQLNLTATVLNQPITELSTGQKQRLGILRALKRNPTFLLLDEVTANLDEKNTLAVETLITCWLQDGSRGVIWCSHDTRQTQRIATRLWQINNTRVMESNL